VTDLVASKPSPTTSDVVACLRTGGVVLLPTDTVFGLAVMPTSAEGVDRLYALKSRPRAKALPIMQANATQVFELGVIMSAAIEQALNCPFVPGALTIAAPIDPQNCIEWLQGRDEVAFRIPNSALLLDILAQVGPLLVSSANLAGAPTPRTVQGVLEQLTGQPDLVVEGEAGADVSSTLVNCSHSPAVIERIGAVSVAELSQWLAVQHD
jgi:L-threonylcarbamoyladenylate synthase